MIRPRHYAMQVLTGEIGLKECPPEFLAIIETHIYCTIREDIAMIKKTPELINQVPANMQQIIKMWL